MYDSLAKKHKQSVIAQSEVAKPTSEGFGSNYDMLNLKLVEDRRTLHSIQSILGKIAKKSELLPHYDDWINATLSTGTGKSDPLLTTLMLWHIDVGNFERGLDIADYALKHRLTMPDNHQRTLATVVAEEVADTAKRLMQAEQPFDEGQVLRASTMTADQDVPDQVRAKLAKIIGELTEDANPELALAQYKTAIKHDAKSGVKGSIKRLEKQLGSSAETEETTDE
nr:phage terminase small subunit [Moraxella sp.]